MPPQSRLLPFLVPCSSNEPWRWIKPSASISIMYPPACSPSLRMPEVGSSLPFPVPINRFLISNYLLMKHEYLETSVWFKDKITDPYQIIAAFFDAADIAHHRKIIKYILQVACSDRCWEKQEPGHLLYEFSLLESVINAAWVLKRGCV